MVLVSGAPSAFKMCPFFNRDTIQRAVESVRRLSDQSISGNLTPVHRYQSGVVSERAAGIFRCGRKASGDRRIWRKSWVAFLSHTKTFEMHHFLLPPCWVDRYNTSITTCLSENPTMLNRRDFLRLGSLAVAGLPTLRFFSPGHQHKSVIMVYLSGGLAHRDTVDLKPLAPSESRRRVQANSDQCPWHPSR
jgi:hypothetical protein